MLGAARATLVELGGGGNKRREVPIFPLPVRESGVDRVLDSVMVLGAQHGERLRQVRLEDGASIVGSEVGRGRSVLGRVP
jgi:hypothetical protein